ncbi:hypothetical protein KNT64_gp051 [Pseudomonas phage PspYZU05]|uniref:Uncharacterized protein n=1 Tax=Pseudomonas phage PspYZU05 TaxID=1983556 RepID=A0A2U7N890_9CAUD|nr:hypothetical protein KNT64_gp051 [Pseudomonas phage PspYZU05]ASD52003.1 hypothetical protein PspYZU05_51 [Pseudomonas phage PspYZU05]
MKPYGITRSKSSSLDWHAGSPSRTGNKTSSSLKRRTRQVFKGMARAESSILTRNETHEDYDSCDCNEF